MYFFSHVVAFVCGMFIFVMYVLFVLMARCVYCCDLFSDCDSTDANKYKHKYCDIQVTVYHDKFL